MKRTKHLLIALSAIALSLTAGAGSLAAQSKIGVVDFQQALLETKDMQAQAAKLEAKFKPRQEALEALSTELQQLQAQLQGADPDKAFELQSEGARKQREAQRMSEDLQAEVDFEREAILQDGAERMRAVLEKLRQDKGLDLIIDVSNAWAAAPELDVTAAATAAYDAAHPVQ